MRQDLTIINWYSYQDKFLPPEIKKNCLPQRRRDAERGKNFSGQVYRAAQESFGRLEAGPTCGTDILPVEKTFPDSYSINPKQDNDYDRLFECLRKEDRLPGKIIHLWTMSDDSGNDGKDCTPELADEYNTLGFYSLLHIARAIGRTSSTDSIHIKVVTPAGGNRR